MSFSLIFNLKKTPTQQTFKLFKFCISIVLIISHFVVVPYVWGRETSLTVPCGPGITFPCKEVKGGDPKGWPIAWLHHTLRSKGGDCTNAAHLGVWSNCTCSPEKCIAYVCLWFPGCTSNVFVQPCSVTLHPQMAGDKWGDLQVCWMSESV